MPNQVKSWVKQITPPVVWQLGKKLTSPVDTYGLSGNYASWGEALAASTGYDSDLILEKTRVALLKVKNGEAAYERDSVLFDAIEYAWPVLAGLMWVAAQNKGRLNVLDFGGSLGSTYFQNRGFLASLPDVHWNIVEQPKHVEVGKAWFGNEQLHFYTDIASCLAETQPNVVLLSSVLQYLEDPYVILKQILELPSDYVILDKTPFWTGAADRLCLQTVPPEIYPASYPSWIFSQAHFYAHLGDWQTMVMFDNPDKIRGPVDFAYQGAILVRPR